MRRGRHRRLELLDVARSKADDRAMGHGGWVPCSGKPWQWSFLVGMTCVARWDATQGWFWRGGGHVRWESATWRFPGVFDPRLATALGVTAVIQHRMKESK